jgi:hypothetical protein
MSDYTIIVPTCKALEDVQALLANIRNAEPYIADRLIPTCLDATPAVNRNYGLDKCQTPFAVMIDDDVTGFPKFFARDLVETLKSDEELGMVSAKLLNGHGEMFMGGAIRDEELGLSIARAGWLPTACVAMHKTGQRFDVGLSWMEDVDYCWTLNKVSPSLFVVDNGIRVLHRNEEKWRKNDVAAAQEYFKKKWGRLP